MPFGSFRICTGTDPVRRPRGYVPLSGRVRDTQVYVPGYRRMSPGIRGMRGYAVHGYGGRETAGDDPK